ncbi:MAG: DUF748 domain-containing protein [Candidatus Omnitrophica bacterium]|nr:DUF748 domain-containing protein [Candidatus Omnitrophota bacterium]
MKKNLRNISVILILIVIIYFGIFAFVNIQGKNILEKFAKENLNLHVQLHSLRLEFPFNFEIKNLIIKGLYCKKINISLGLFNPFDTKYVIDEVLIEDVKGRIKRDNNGNIDFPLKNILVKSTQESNFYKDEDLALENTLSEEKDKINESKGSSGDKKIIFIINNIDIKNGEIEFENFVKDEKLIITFKNIDVKVKNISYPEFSKMYLNFTSSLQTDKGVVNKGININGWVDYLKRDMDIKASINEISYEMFNQYYPMAFHSDNLGVKGTQVSIKSGFNSKNNDLSIDNVLSIDSIEFLEDKEGKTKKRLLRTILALIQGDREKPEIKFRIKTKMDAPNLNFSSIVKSLKDSIPIGPGLIAGELIDMTRKTVSGSIDGVGEVVGKTTKVVGEGLDGVKELTVDTAVGTIDTAVETIKGTLGVLNDVLKPSGKDKPE